MSLSHEDRILVDTALSSISCSLPRGSKIIVGLSGGVDSSVSIALLKELGYDVMGLFMKNWEESDTSGVCSTEADYHDIALTTKILEVPFFTVNFTKEYKDEVFDLFIQGLKEGRTPNPDILCNLEIKFKHLLQKARGLNADLLATGHYAHIETNNLGKYTLQRARDLSKDQTYFLYTATQETLQYTLFPLGKILKQTVRRLAEIFRLPVAQKKDSTGICFIGKRDFRSFISEYIGYTPGKMINEYGTVIGQHQGLAYYTIGQRKGLFIGGIRGAGGDSDPWFVAKKDVQKNELMIVQGENHPALFSRTLYIQKAHWIDEASHTFPMRCSAKIRYRQKDQLCTVTKDNDTIVVLFDEPQRAITLEQSVVFYDNEVCLGGGIITDVGLDIE